MHVPSVAPSAPPRAVSVAGNGTSVRISWQPPPPAEQNGVIRDYQVRAGGTAGPLCLPCHCVPIMSSLQIWCLGNESRFHINQSVEGTVLATVLRGLVPGVPYHAEVAAATSAGVGARSVPIPIRIGESLVTTVGGGRGETTVSSSASVSPMSLCWGCKGDPTVSQSPSTSVSPSSLWLRGGLAVSPSLVTMVGGGTVEYTVSPSASTSVSPLSPQVGVSGVTPQCPHPHR